jgi:hypothetical protein
MLSNQQAAGRWPVGILTGLPLTDLRLVGRGPLLRVKAHFVQALAYALGKHVENIGAGVDAEFLQLARVGEALLKRLLRSLGLLHEAILFRTRLGPITHQYQRFLHSFLHDLSLALRQRAHALDRELVGLGQRRKILTLRLDDDCYVVEIAEHISQVEESVFV